MKINLFFLSLLAFSPHFSAIKALTTYSDVATIFYENCSGCHHQGGVAPMPSEM